MAKNTGKGSGATRRRPPAAKAGKTYASGGMVIGHGARITFPVGVPTVFAFDPAWSVEPKETVTGSIGSFVQWQARRAGRQGPVRGEIQMAKYECRIQAISPHGYGNVRTRESLMFEFDVLHRPDEGDLMLAAKVMAMAVTQPEWELYKDKVAEGW